METNISSIDQPAGTLASILHLLAQPVRIQILLILARQEACVCHLEAALGIRQAVISQHLMLLRKGGLVTTNRDGRNIFYRVTKPGLEDVILKAGGLAGISPETLKEIARRPLGNCHCPHCNPGLDPPLPCSSKSFDRSTKLA